MAQSAINETYEQMIAREKFEENVAFNVMKALCKAVADYCGESIYLRRHSQEWAMDTLRDELTKAGMPPWVAKPAQKGKQSLPARIRTVVHERDQYRCQKCGDWHDLTVDHIIPHSKGGSDDLENLQTLCRKCNCSKGDRT